MPLSRFLDPKNDFAFKQIFGTEKNKDILIHFLNDVLGYKKEEQIKEVTFLKPIQDLEVAIYRQSIVDVLCKDIHGTQFIVEMQVSKHKGFEKRAQLYAAKAYSRQIIKEDEHHKNMAVYAKLKGVVFLAIADFIVFPDKKDWKSTHRMLDTKTYENDLKDFYFIFFELPKFKKTIDKLETLEEKWAYFFKHAHKSTLVEMDNLIGKDLVIKKAFQVIDQAAWSEEELLTYEHVIKVHMDNLAVEEQKIEDAEKRGEAIGEARGEARGEAQGEYKKAVTMARKMLIKNRSVEEIMEFTDLTQEQIASLK